MKSEQDIDRIIRQFGGTSGAAAPVSPERLNSEDDIDAVVRKFGGTTAAAAPVAPPGLPATASPAKGYVSPRLPAGGPPAAPTINPLNPWLLTSRDPTVMSEQAMHVLEGLNRALSPIEHPIETAKSIPGYAKQVSKAVAEKASGGTLYPGATRQLAEQTAAPFVPLAQALMGDRLARQITGAPAPPPDSPEWAEAARNAGMMLGGAELPNVISGYGALQGRLTRNYDIATGRQLLEPTRDQINNISTIVQPAVKTGGPQAVASDVQPYWKEAMDRLGMQDFDVAVKERAPQSDLQGDLYRGTTKELHDAMAQRMTEGIPGQPPKALGYQAKPLPLEVADLAVDIAHEPIDRVMRSFGSYEFPEVQQAVAKGLRDRAAATIDDPLSRAYTTLAEKVEQTPPTGQEINNLKVYANKETGRLFDLLPSKEIAASVTPIWAYRTLGDLIRENFYPALRERGVLDMEKFGRAEASAIRARDGAYASWADAAGAQAPQQLLTWTDRLRGETGLPPLTKHGAVRSALRAVVPQKAPLAQFNQMFRDGIGPTAGYVETTPKWAPMRENLLPGAYNLPSGAESFVGGETATPVAGTRAMRTGRLLTEGQPALPAIPSESSVRGVAATPAQRIQNLLPAAGYSSTLTPVPPPESLRESLARMQSAASRQLRQRLGQGPFAGEGPRTATEYLKTKGGRKKPSPPPPSAPTPPE